MHRGSQVQLADGRVEALWTCEPDIADVVPSQVGVVQELALKQEQVQVQVQMRHVLR